MRHRRHRRKKGRNSNGRTKKCESMSVPGTKRKGQQTPRTPTAQLLLRSCTQVVAQRWQLTPADAPSGIAHTPHPSLHKPT